MSIISISFIFLSSNDVKASHAMGADIQYQCVGNDSFLVTLNFYRFCDGIAAPPTAPLDISSLSGCGTSQTVILQPVDSILFGGDYIPNGSDVTPLCDAQINQSSCGTGSFPGVEQHTYSGLVILSGQCTDWVFGYNLNARNDEVTNLVSPQTQDLYVETTLNNVLGCNNSPQFTTSPVPYACSGRLFTYNHGAIDSDGDSLVFTSVNPLDASGVPIAYQPGYSPSNPLNTSTPFTVDPRTGQFSFTPIGVQFVVITILVEEYRNGVLIGSTMRDIQISINPAYCTDKPISNTNTTTGTVTGGVVTSPTSIEICPGDSLVFEVNVVDTTAGQTNQLTLLSNAAQSIPGSSFVIDTSTLGDTLFGTFIWVPTGLDTGNNILVMESGDASQCPIKATEISSINIYVLAGTYAGPDLFYCPAGGPIRLSVYGGNNFTWAPPTGLSDPNIRHPLASPSQTQEYIVTSDLSSNCKNKDTIIVYRVPDFLLDVLPSNDTINVCRNGAQDLEVLTDAQWAPYTYSWEPAAALDDPFSGTPTALVDTTTKFYLTVTSDTGCTIRDTLLLNVVGVGPKVNVIPDKEIICPGDTINLDLELFPLACGPAIEGCGPSRPPVQIPFGTDTTSYFASPFSGSNDVGRSQLLYRASDLRAAGLGSGTIFRIALEADIIQSGNGFGGTYQNLTIKMGCTEENNLDPNDWIPLNTVVWGPQDFNISQGMLTFNLFQFEQYDWDGQSNLVIEFCYTNPNGSAPGGDDQLVTTTTGYTSMTRNYANNQPNGCSISNAFGYSELPNIVFTICDPVNSGYTYSWTPTTGVSNPSIPNPYVVVTDSNDYRVEVADTLCYGSGEITLAPQTGYGIEIIPGDTFICNPGDTIQLGLQPTGTPPPSELVCGTNGTACGNTPTVTRQIGTGTTTSSTSTPYDGFWEDSRVQYLIRASELQQLGLISGTINSIAFNITSKNSSQPYSGFTIQMGCTSLNEFTTSNFASGSMYTVFGPATVSTSSGWNTHQFSNTFDWDGTSNILVEICYNNLDWTSSDVTQYTTTSYQSTLYDFTDGVIGCSLSSPTSSTIRPNMRFNMCEAGPGETNILWTPNVDISNDTIENPFVYPTVTTDYIVDYTFAKGCPVSDTVTIGVTTFTASAPNDTSICVGDSVLLSLGNGNVFTWSPDSSLSCGNCANVYAFPDTTTTYSVLVQDSATGCSELLEVIVTVNNLPEVNISVDSILCFVNSITLDAGNGFSSYLWNTGTVNSSIVANSDGLYYVTVTDSFGCSNSDSVTLVEGVAPVFTLPNDTIICEIDSFVLNGPRGDYSYYWNTGSNDSTISAFFSGSYSLTVVDTTGCAYRDTTNLLLNESVSLNIGNDTTICTGTSLTLSSNVTINLFDFMWSDSSTASTLTVTTGGTYSLTVTDTSGCTSSDTIVVTYDNGPIVDLGNDTALCAGQSIILSGGGTTKLLDDFNWSTGQTAPQISVNTTNLYSLTVTNEFMCSGSDSIFIDFVNPQVSITGRTAICDGEPAVLVATPGYASYFWLPTEESNDSIIVTAPGQYTVTVTDSAAGCEGQASITVTVNNATPIDLGNHIEICSGDSIIIGQSDQSYVSYNWNTSNADTAFIQVSSPDVYSVTATDVNGCTTSDSVMLSFFSDNSLEIEDINACTDFTTNVSVDGSYLFYNWSTGDSTSSITITEHGSYSVTVVDSFECTYVETFTVNEVAFEVEAFANPNEIELEETSTLGVTGNGSGNYGYVWTADPEDLTLIDQNIAAPSVSPENPQTIYTVVVTDSTSGCISSDTTLLLVNSGFALPNAFAPNGGSANNQYFDVIGNVTIKTFQIFNRWGEMVYNNNTPLTGWDGKYNGNDQPVGTYIYYVVILDASGEELAPITGNVNLIR